MLNKYMWSATYCNLTVQLNNQVSWTEAQSTSLLLNILVTNKKYIYTVRFEPAISQLTKPQFITNINLPTPASDFETY